MKKLMIFALMLVLVVAVSPTLADDDTCYADEVYDLNTVASAWGPNFTTYLLVVDSPLIENWEEMPSTRLVGGVYPPQIRDHTDITILGFLTNDHVAVMYIPISNLNQWSIDRYMRTVILRNKFGRGNVTSYSFAPNTQEGAESLGLLDDCR